MTDVQMQTTVSSSTTQKIDDQFPDADLYAEMIKEDRASEPFWVRYRDFKEHEYLYKQFFIAVPEYVGR